MSLINDALKRAKEVQDKAPPPDSAWQHLRPVEARPTGLRGSGLLLPTVLTLVALGGLFFLWQAAPSHLQAKNTNGSPVAGTLTNPLAGGARSPMRAAAVSEAGKVEAAVPEQRRAGDSAPYPAATAPTTLPAPANAPETAAVASSVTTNLSTLPVPPVVKPAILRLQAIVYHPSRPSAMIGGKTVYVGDRVGDFRVLAIDQQSATLAGTTGTHVLTLSE